MNYFLGIDFGTSGVRAIAINPSKEIAAVSLAEYDIRDCETWLLALYEVITGLPQEIRQNTKKIVVDGTSSTVLICDRNGKAIATPMIYSDACESEVVNQVKKIAPPKHSVCSATSSFAKLISFLAKVEIPDSFTSPVRSLYFLHQADWLGYLLHGKLGVSDYHNALKLGYDPLLLQYPDWLQSWLLNNPAVVLPEVFAPSKTVGKIEETIALKLNLPLDCAIGAGTTDSNAAFLASVGTATPAIGTAVTSLGSTMVLKVLSDRPINDPSYGIYSHRFEHPELGCLWLVGGASNVGGAVLRQFFTDSELQEFSDRIDPQIASSLDYYPLTKIGDRFPINDPLLVPRLEPRPDDPIEFLHGLLESMARIEAKGYQLLQKLGASPIQRIYTAGGGAKNQVWTKIRDRLLQISMQQSQQPEAAYGAALYAALN
ncbi:MULTISPECIES: FGGY-family carbohydrate kinase [Pseudanabaena]|jgi:D-ribulokinase|uniref:FGGY-family carbohydrate kinase n=1 Tax=Pseudanabaena TaxID=1152 RepID=UPI00247A1ECB|nr:MULTISPECIES: FGGY-family carbohydrate kinase [Pseudanabaena]MEA5487257.1 FGGY-family carbohydrate kinase [Pseudanabaena sp. CCNP1317]WGS70475.1 FGGY-family carbohydrate kinase [Pseudanabaena galeata CCNP1313]